MRLCLCVTRPIVHSFDNTEVNVERQLNDIEKENWRTWRKTCPSATFLTTNPTWTALDVIPGLHSEKLATTHLGYGMAFIGL
jgi:hypothetical protein